jgi:hypothetical protein
MTLALQANAKLSFSEVSFPPFWDLGDVRFAPKRPQCLTRLTAQVCRLLDALRAHGSPMPASTSM